MPCSGCSALHGVNPNLKKKCKYTFHQTKELGRKFNITIAWFYGEAGHRKGLVDATSSFGCKQPFKHVIVTEDRWFKNTLEMVSYLREYFKDDSSKDYHYIVTALLAEAHKPKPTEHIIKPCRKFHLIAVNSDGTLM